MEIKSSWNKSWIIAITSLVIAHFFFGTTYAINKFLTDQEFDPILLAFVRVSVATLGLLPIYLKYKSEFSCSSQDWYYLILIGLVFQPAAISFEYMGTKYTTASNMAIILCTDVIPAIFLSVVFLKERLTFYMLLGAILAFFGVSLVLWDDLRNFTIHTNVAFFGDMLALLAVLSWSLYTIGCKKILSHMQIFGSLFWICLMTSVGLALISLTRGSLGDIIRIPWFAWGILLYLGIFCSGLAHFLYYKGLQILPASLVVITHALPPIFGVAFAMLLLGEKMGWFQASGGCVIVIGLIVALWLRKDNSTHK